MIPFSDAAVAVVVAWHALVAGSTGTSPKDTSAAPRAELRVEARPDSVRGPRDSVPVSVQSPMTIRGSALGYLEHRDTLAPADTIRKPRQKAIVYSDAYGKRLTLHRRLSWAMLPLFAVSYVTGDQLIKDPSGAPSWARNLHGPAATGSALLFGANSVTGVWNLWEGRHDPNNRTKKILHSLMFTAASAGFVYAGTQLANDAEQSQAKRREHRNVALASMGVSTASWLIMLLGN